MKDNEIIKIVKLLLSKSCLIQGIPDIDNPNTLILSLDLSGKVLERNVLDKIMLDNETVDWIMNTTKEEREELKRLSKIAYYKKQIEVLEQPNSLSSPSGEVK